MTTAVETGIGSEFWLKPAGAGALVLLDEVTNIPFPNGTTDLIDASHMKTVGLKDYIAAPLQEGEDADLEMNWIPGGPTEALCLAAKNQTREFKIVIPAGGGKRQVIGKLLVRNYTRNNPMGTKRTATLTVKWVGEMVESAVTP